MALPLQTLAAAAVVGLVVAGGAASTAGNTVPSTRAGQGATSISGYVVSSVVYTLGTGANGDKINSVAFSLDEPATTVRVRLTTNGDYTDCSNGGSGNAWTCSFAVPASASAAATLDVVAKNN